MNSISGVQQRHTNQYSFLLRLFLLHLKLWPCGRQMAQHISWSQGYSTSPLISESILWTSTLVWTAPDNRSISAVEDRILRWLQHCYKTCYKKDGHHQRQACIIGRWYHYGDVISEQMNLYMTILYSLFPQECLTYSL